MTQTKRPGVFFVLVGPGGVGKNALLNLLLQRFDDLKQFPTATTRPPRQDEIDGVHHLFVTENKFKSMITSGELLEHQEVHPGKFYGAPRQPIDDAIAGGYDLIADIEDKGARAIKAAYPHDSVIIFVAPPSFAALLERMRARQSTESQINERMARAADEMQYAASSDYVVVNDVIDDAVEQISDIIRSTREQNRQQEAIQSAFTVRFAVEVLPVFHQEAAISGNGPVHQPMQPGVEPARVALDTLAEMLAIKPDASRLRLDARSNGDAVLIQYDNDARSYGLTYRYIYELEQRLNLSPGWEWQPYTAWVRPQPNKVYDEQL